MLSGNRGDASEFILKYSVLAGGAAQTALGTAG